MKETCLSDILIGMNAYDSETICITGSDFDRNSVGLQLNRVVGGSISGCEFLEDWHNGMWIATGSENTAVSGSEFDEDYGSGDTMRGQCACKRIGVQGEHTYGPLPWKGASAALEDMSSVITAWMSGGRRRKGNCLEQQMFGNCGNMLMRGVTVQALVSRDRKAIFISAKGRSIRKNAEVRPFRSHMNETGRRQDSFMKIAPLPLYPGQAH